MDGAAKWVARQSFRVLWFPALVLSLLLGWLEGPLPALLGLMTPIFAVMAWGLCYPVQCVALMMARRDLAGSVECFWRTLAVLGPWLVAWSFSRQVDWFQPGSAGHLALLEVLLLSSLWGSRHLAGYCIAAPAPPA